jgi:hypothetical protein
LFKSNNSVAIPMPYDRQVKLFNSFNAFKLFKPFKEFESVIWETGITLFSRHYVWQRVGH